MTVRSWLGKLLKREPQTIYPLSIYKVETPDKIIETKIQPVKIPTIVDLGERLGSLSRDLSYLRNEVVTKTWFTNEFEDATPRIIGLLNEMNENLRTLLSKFTKDTTATQLTDVEHFSTSLNTPDFILKIIKSNKKVRYKDIKKQVPVSDPTLSKYLRILVHGKKIRRIKVAKAVFYEAV